MKKYFILILAISSILLANKNIKLGGFGGPRVKMMNINDTIRLIGGGGGSISINDNFSFGIYGYGNPGEDTKYPSIKNNNIGYGYMGINVGYSMKTNSIFQPAGIIGVGYGVAGNDHKSNRLADTFNLIEANIGVQIKVLRWFKIYPYIGYTAVLDIADEYSRYSNEDFSGINYGIELNFGK